MPGQTVPIHTNLGIQISEGQISGQTYWAERCDAICLLSDLDSWKDEFISCILSESKKALQFLHDNDCIHGDVRSERIGVGPEGRPIWFGVGRHEGTKEKDISDFDQLCRKRLGISSNELNTLRRPALKIPEQIIKADMKKDLLYEHLKLASRNQRDAPDYDHDGLTPSASFSEITSTNPDTMEWTSSWISPDPMEPQSISVVGELLSWLSQDAERIQLSNSYGVGKQELILPLDPLPAPNGVVLREKIAPNIDDQEGEHTDIITQREWKELSKTLRQEKEIEAEKITALIMMIIVLFFVLAFLY